MLILVLKFHSPLPGKTNQFTGHDYIFTHSSDAERKNQWMPIWHPARTNINIWVLRVGEMRKPQTLLPEFQPMILHLIFQSLYWWCWLGVGKTYQMLTWTSAFSFTVYSEQILFSSFFRSKMLTISVCGTVL